MDYMTSPEPVSSESSNLGVLIWLATLGCMFLSFFMFLPSLIFYLVKKDDSFVQDQAKEALNFSITMMLAGFVSFILCFVLIGVFLLLIVAIFSIVICILGAISASKGDAYRAPLCIRLIK